MSINPIRKILHSVGLDLRRHQPQTPLLHFLISHQIGAVFDVGANIGQFSTLVREVLPEVDIYAFEPIDECYIKLVRTFTNDQKYHPYHLALGATKIETAPMNKNAYLPSSSLLPTTRSHTEHFPHTEHTTLETVRVERLDDLDIKIQQKALLKMDVQGYEMEVLKGAESMLSDVAIIITEVSFIELYKSQPLFNDIYQHLYAKGFSYQGSLQAKHDPSTNAVLFEDAVFIRTKIDRSSVTI